MWQTLSYYGSLFLESAAGMFGIRLYKEPRYDVVERLPGQVEIRRYAPRLAVEAVVRQSGETGRNEAFRLLFAYIAGANRTAAASAGRAAMTMPVAVNDNERIAMTVPVPSMEGTGGLRMQFFLPASYTMDTAPRPLHPGLKLRLLPEETVAALRYSGTGRDSGKRQAELVALLAGASWRPAGAGFTQFYDAPFTPPPLRRNEAVIPVTRDG